LPNKPVSLLYISGPSAWCNFIQTAQHFPRISGTVYNDDNHSGTQDANEKGHPHVTIKAEPNHYIFPANDTGFYYYTVDTGAAYTISIDPLPYYTVVPASQTTNTLSLKCLHPILISPFSLLALCISLCNRSAINGSAGQQATHIITVKITAPFRECYGQIYIPILCLPTTVHFPQLLAR